jgi:CBS domain containing-hemolysin-like protein
LLLIGVVMGCVGTMAAVAVVSVNHIELYRWIAGRLPGARAAHSLLSSPVRTLGAALGLAAAGALLTGAAWRAVIGDSDAGPAVVAVFLIAVPLVTTLMYALPRVVGQRWPDTTIRNTIPLVNRLAPVLNPVLPREATVRPRSNLALSRAGAGAPNASDTAEIELVSGVLAFTERSVKEVMTPRTEIVAVREGAPVEEIGRVFADSGFSRLPVYRESLDQIGGMFYAFDLLKLTPGAELGLRPITMTPASRPCADLLFEMQRDRRQLAVVLDEYGGTAGIATLQDLLEELVDETFEAAEADGEADLGTGEVLEVPGETPTDEIAESFNAELPAGAETVGGLLTRAAGRIPRAGERFELAGLEFYVLAATATRVERLAVRQGASSTIQLVLEQK